MSDTNLWYFFVFNCALFIILYRKFALAIFKGEANSTTITYFLLAVGTLALPIIVFICWL